MNLYCLGINHRTAPLEVREKLWFSDDETRATLPTLKNIYFEECVLVSTCNRTELYYIPKQQGENGEPIWKILAMYKNAGSFVQEHHFYALDALHAVKHLFGVASGIDSMVLGDIQILSQIKESFQIAKNVRCTGISLNRLFENALHVGKRSRTETEISAGAVSVSYAAAELASKIFEDLSKRTALLIGAGETGTLTAKHLASRSIGKLIITNRTRQRAEELAVQLQGHVVDFERIGAELESVDIIVSAVDSTTPILSASDLRQTMKLRGNRPLVIIDIGVPRNIDPAANSVSNIFLHDLDTLNHVIDINLTRRRAEIPKVQQIMLDELTAYNTWYNSLQVTPTIQELRDQFESIRKSEVEKHLHHFATDRQEEIEMLTKRIINKILHTPMVNLRNSSDQEDEDDKRHKVHLIRHLFGLDQKKKND